MFQKITRRNLDKFLERYATDQRILDIGSGGSRYGKFFPNRLTVDIDPARKPEIVADAHHLPFKDGEFNMILCTEVLEHVKNPQQVINELSRVLSSEGTCILTTRFMYPIHDAPHDYWRFTKYGLGQLFSSWTDVVIEPETKSFSAMAALLQRMCYQLEFRFNRPVKMILFAIVFIFDKLNGLIINEYGDIQKIQKNENIFSTGYYVVAKKKN